jgi:hypothetical protein
LKCIGRLETIEFRHLLVDIEKERKSWQETGKEKNIRRKKRLEAFLPSANIKWKYGYGTKKNSR